MTDSRWQQASHTGRRSYIHFWHYTLSAEANTMTSTGMPVLIAILTCSPLNYKLPSGPTSCLASRCCSSSAGHVSCSRAGCTCSAHLTASMGLRNATLNASPSVVTCTYALHQDISKVCVATSSGALEGCSRLRRLETVGSFAFLHAARLAAQEPWHNSCGLFCSRQAVTQASIQTKAAWPKAHSQRSVAAEHEGCGHAILVQCSQCYCSTQTELCCPPHQSFDSCLRNSSMPLPELPIRSRGVPAPCTLCYSLQASPMLLDLLCCCWALLAFCCSISVVVTADDVC